MVILMIGGTQAAVIHHVGVAVVLMSGVVNKKQCNYCLNKFYLDMLVQ